MPIAIGIFALRPGERIARMTRRHTVVAACHAAISDVRMNPEYALRTVPKSYILKPPAISPRTGHSTPRYSKNTPTVRMVLSTAYHCKNCHILFGPLNANRYPTSNAGTGAR